MNSSKRFAVLFSSLLAAACAEPGAEPKTAAQGQSTTFTYAPELNKPYRETMRRLEEFSIPGSPMRDAEEWTMEWEVVTTQEANLFKRSLKLVGLKIKVNGADILRGDEVKPSGVTIEVLTDKDSNVVDVRGSDKFSEAIVMLGAPENQPVLRRVFSPERLKALAVVRTTEQNADFVGKPSQVGSQWTANAPEVGGTKQVRVVGEAPCGSGKCVQVVREYQVDRTALYASISDRVKGYVQSQGGDPSKVQLVGMDLKLEDSLLIQPNTMNYYGAKFLQDATIRVAGPNGELPVALKVLRQSDYQY